MPSPSSPVDRAPQRASATTWFDVVFALCFGLTCWGVIVGGVGLVIASVVVLCIAVALRKRWCARHPHEC